MVVTSEGINVMCCWLDGLLFIWISQEFPYVRYRAPREQDGSPASTRSLIPFKLAEILWKCIEKYKSIPNYPQNETCDLLILDRSVDQVYWTFS